MQSFQILQQIHHTIAYYSVSMTD